MKLLGTTLISAAALLASVSFASAAEHVVQMLNAGTDGPVVFEPGYVHAAGGDTIHFVATNPGHFVETVATPDGVTPWLSEISADFTVEVTAPGVYVYICPPHVMMGMVGVVQVDAAVNLDAIQPALTELRARITMNQERLDSYLAQIQ